MIFKLQHISYFRAELMGFAILWIMSFHFEFMQIPLLPYITQYGYAGVEIFMFVSGFGIFYSLRGKSKNLFHFYKKRITRIFPAYYLIGILDSIFVFHDNLVTYLFRFSTIGYWFGSTFDDWYIPSLIILYIFSPQIIRLLKPNKLAIVWITITIFILLTICFTFNPILERHYYFLVYRIPAFLFGMLCAYWQTERKGDFFFVAINIICLPVFIILFRLYPIYYNYRFSAFLFLMPAIIITLTSFFRMNISMLNYTLSNIGKASLEIYMVQGFLYHLYIFHFIVIPIQFHDIIAITSIMFSTFSGILLHHLINNFLKVFKEV